MEEEQLGTAEPVDVLVEPTEEPVDRRSAIERALSEAGIDEGEEPSEPPKERERDEQGRFKAKEEPEAEAKPEAKPEEKPSRAPAGFDETAQREWEQTPASVKGATERRMSEMQAGLDRYQQEFGDAKPYADWARENNTTVGKLIAEYAGFEEVLRNDPVRGFQQIAERLGLDLQKVVAAAGEQPQPQQQPVQPQITPQAVQQQVNETIQARENQAAIRAFASTKPDFEALRNDMAIFWNNGKIDKNKPLAEALEEAYQMARRLNGSVEPASQAQQAAQTREKAQLMISGAPASGSDPGNRPVPKSAREAAAMALRDAGI